MLLVGDGQDAGAGGPDGGGASVVDIGGGVQAEAAVAPVLSGSGLRLGA